MGKILQIGEELDDGRLKVVGQLESSGEYAEIYVVHKTRVPIECLLKVNLPHDMLDKDAIAESTYEYSKEDHISRTDREVRMITLFDHPNIAQVDDLIEFKGRYKGILFRPISEAKTLRELINEENENSYHIDPEERYGTEIRFLFRANKFLSISEGLLKAQNNLLNNKSGNSVMHRDIRPENIVVDKFNEAYLIDFGLACFAEDFNGKWGSLKYGPPEIYEHKGFTDSDSWSIGLCLYEVLTGQHLIDNSPDLKERRVRIIEKVRSLNQNDAAIAFSEDLLEKMLRIERQYNDMNEIKSLSVRLGFAQIMNYGKDFGFQLFIVTNYCLPKIVFRNLKTTVPLGSPESTHNEKLKMKIQQMKEGK